VPPKQEGAGMRFKLLASAVMASAILCVAAGAAIAETAESFYQGKVVRLVVGYSAGGGYDSYARMLAPHLERRLGATVVVENRPGGGGLVALNQVATAEPDGLSLILISAASAAFSQVVEAEGARFDLMRLGFLGRVIDEKRTLVWGAGAPYSSVAAMVQSPRPILLGSTARTSPIGAASAFLAEALELNAKIVVGYKGSKEIDLAAARGEVDGFVVSDSSTARYGREGGLLPFAVLSRERSNLLPEVPTIFELVDLTPERVWWLDYCDALFGLGRSLVTTPDIPAERLAFLQQAVADVLTDPQVVEEATAKSNPLNYAPPTSARRLIETVVGSLTKEQVAKVREVALEKYK